jgi:hypothetical protein
MVPTKFSSMGLHLRCQRLLRGSLCRIPWLLRWSAHTSITRIKTVDSNQVIVQTHRHRTLSVRVAHAIPTWDKRHPKRRVTLRQFLKPEQVRRLRPKHAHATFATNLAILHLTVLIRQLTSKRPRANCSKTRISWCYGKSLGTTKTNKPAPLASLKHGGMTTYVLYAIRTSPSTTAATPKTSVSTSTSIPSSLNCAKAPYSN